MIGTRRQSTMPKLAYGLSLRTDRSSRSGSLTPRTSLSRQASRLGDANLSSHLGASLTGPLTRQHTAGGRSKPRRSSMLQPGAPADLQINTRCMPNHVVRTLLHKSANCYQNTVP